ncbi:MAG TPA: CHASE2 domain-containing protein [Bryobacteraceae bacterium]|nr:CHASE2 domain-containing protein [Bryobacteraceae bacterium]
MRPPSAAEIKSTVRRAAVALFFFVLFFAFDRGPEMLDEPGGGSEPLKKLLDAQFFYQKLVTFTPFANPVEFASVISLRQPDLPSSAFENACVAREYLAELLPRVAALAPRVIALDLAFVKGGCDLPSVSTADLADAVRRAALTSKIVVGLASLTVDEARQTDNLTAAQARMLGLHSNELLLYEHEDFTAGTSDNRIRSGLLRLNADLRKVPLGWPVREVHGNAGTIDPKPKILRSLSFEAALANNDSAYLRTIDDWDFHPLSVQQKREEFVDVPAICVMQAENAGFDWNGSDCAYRVGTRPAGSPSMANAIKDLLRPVVLIGWTDDPKDIHNTPAGELPGVFLQANFVEALSAPHLLKSVSPWLQIAVSLFWFALIEYQFWKDGSGRHVTVCCITVSVFFLIVCYVAVHNFGYYLDLWPPSALAIGLRIIQDWAKPYLTRATEGASVSP